MEKGKMKQRKFESPLSVYFIWHPADRAFVGSLVDYCTNRFQRSLESPFSRTMDIPIFYSTSTTNNPPREVAPLSQHNIAFCFMSANIMADKLWVKYLEKLMSSRLHIVPVALNEKVLTSANPLEKINHIRLYEYETKIKYCRFMITVAHELYRFALNSHGRLCSPAKRYSVELFISHSKNDKWVLNLARKIKQVVDNSNMNNFFDATDIAPAFSFGKELESHLLNSTLISIQSDTYSSRYWCQKEILFAKQNKRPILCVNHLDNCEDRLFPYSANVPSVHLTPQKIIIKNDIYRILEATIIETVRFHYHTRILNNYKKSNWFDKKAYIMSRPPELADLPKLISEKKGKIRIEHNLIIYPEPPVYDQEHDFLNKLNIKADTPLSADHIDLSGKKIGLSISDISFEESMKIGLPENTLELFSRSIARHCLSRNAIIVYGGDLRPNGFTEFIFTEAIILNDRQGKKAKRIRNFIAWPIFNSNTQEMKEWTMKYAGIAEMIDVQPPKSINKYIASHDQYLTPTNPENCFVWSKCLTYMREKMISKCDFRICIGGKICGFKGKYPGLYEESIIAIQKNKPLYLLGGFGGISSYICDMLIKKDTPEELTLDWQIRNTAGYGDLVELSSRKTKKDSIDYTKKNQDLINMGIDGLSKINGLTKNENRLLFTTPFIDHAIFIILKGIKRVMNS